MSELQPYLGSERLRGGPNAEEVQRKNNFTLLIPEAAIGTFLELGIHKMEIPKRTITEIGIDYGNEKYFVAGKPTQEDATFTVKDLITADAAKAINDWFNEVYNPSTGVIGRSSVYKKEATLQFMGPDGTQPRQWRLIGMWPKSVNFGGGDMTATGDGAMNFIEATFKVDKVIYDEAAP